MTDTQREDKPRGRLTPKQRVLRKFRNAHASQGALDLWAIFGSRFGDKYLYLSSPRTTAALAWADAAARHL